MKICTRFSVLTALFIFLSSARIFSSYAEDTQQPEITSPPIWSPGMTDSSGQLVPPPLFNQDGTPFQNRENFLEDIPQRTTPWFPGMRDADGIEIPAPLYNLDGTPYVEGVSQPPEIPIYNEEDVAPGSLTMESLLARTVEWYPGMLDRNGNEIPAPIFNPDGSTYIEGESPRPKIPVYAEVSAKSISSIPIKLSDKGLIKKINSQIKSTDISLRKIDNLYTLSFAEKISALDSSFYLSAIHKKSNKKLQISISIDSLGQAVAFTKVNLKKYNLFIKRGISTLNQVNFLSD